MGKVAPDLIDKLRDVPELAVRLLCGGAVRQDPSRGTVIITFQGESIEFSKDVFEYALKVAKAMSIDDTPVSTMNDVLQLRHRAEDLFTDQFLLGDKKIPKVLFVPAGDMASAFYRARIPAEAMTDAGDAIAHWTTRLDLLKLSRYQVLWVQLATSPILYAIAKKAQEHGKKVVYDLDDKFDAILPENPSSEIYVQQKKDEVWDMIRMADAVTVTTKDLADMVRPFAKRVYVLPNYVPAAILPRAQHKPVSKDNPFKILWAGSPSHKRDLAIVSPVIRKILEVHQGSVRFVCFGDRAPVELAGVSKYVDLMPFAPFIAYGQLLSDVDAHVAIAPLEKNSFNDAKSAVKYLEYSACEYASLLSPVGEYADLPGDAPKLMVKDDDWERALMFAITSQDAMRKMGEDAQKWVRQNRCIMKTKAKIWTEVANEILQEQPAARASA